MTFRDQIRSTIRLGLAVVAGGAVLFLAVYAARTAGYITISDVFFFATAVPLAIGALSLVAGVIGRSGHRWVWFNVAKRSTRTLYGRTVPELLLSSPASPVLRLWLHLDREGNDRDGGL